MSLEFDPEFVDTKVQLLESDIARLGNSFVVTSGRVLDIDNKIAYKESYLRCSLSPYIIIFSNYTHSQPPPGPDRFPHPDGVQSGKIEAGQSEIFIISLDQLGKDRDGG